MASLPKAMAAVAGIVFLVTGIWALADPRSFYDSLATYPPYNRHLFHDIGAFQIGIGATLFAGLKWGDGLLVALAGGAAGAIAHAYSHFIDLDVPGANDALTYLLAVLALALVGAAVIRARELPR